MKRCAAPRSFSYRGVPPPERAACLIDRSGGKAKVGVKLVAPASMKVPARQADKLPPHLRDIPAVKPGSRGLS